MKQDRGTYHRRHERIVLLSLLPFVFASCATLPRQYLIIDGDTTPQSSLAASTSHLININRASAAELERLPGIGKVMAERIVAHRSLNGEFRRIEHLMMVRGINERKYREVRPFIVK